MSDASAVSSVPAAAPAVVIRRKGFARRYALAVAGAGILVFWMLAAVLAPLITPYPPDAVDLPNRLLPISTEHWFGTDALGRDVFTRVIFCARISLVVGFAVVMIAATIGTILGACAAFAGRWVEEALMRLTDLVLAFPPIILAMAIAAAMGIGVVNTAIAMLIVWWPKFARLSRSLVLVERSRDYVDAARASGFGPAYILFRQILPNTLGPMMVLITLDLGYAILAFAGLSFLGLGVVPPTAEWGAMVAEGRELVEQWWVATFPGFAILTVVMGFNFLGDGVRDWLDPYARSS